MSLHGIPLSDLLGFSVLAAVVTTIGNLIALYLKDVLAVRSVERWKARQSLLAAYKKYRDPILLSAREIMSRFYALAVDEESRYERLVTADMLKPSTAGVSFNSLDKEHYLRYRLTSNIYRLCSFLAWLELYRQEVVTLDTGSVEVNRRLGDILERIRDDLANGRLNVSEDWHDWRDALIFREEQRAIGSRMITYHNGRAILMDYGTLSDLLESDGTKARWTTPAIALFIELHDKKDFRLVRMLMLIVHLGELLSLLTPGPLPSDIQGMAEKALGELTSLGFEPSPPLQ